MKIHLNPQCRLLALAICACYGSLPGYATNYATGSRNVLSTTPYTDSIIEWTRTDSEATSYSGSAFVDGFNVPSGASFTFTNNTKVSLTATKGTGVIRLFNLGYNQSANFQKDLNLELAWNPNIVSNTGIISISSYCNLNVDGTFTMYAKDFMQETSFGLSASANSIVTLNKVVAKGSNCTGVTWLSFTASKLTIKDSLTITDSGTSSGSYIGKWGFSAYSSEVIVNGQSIVKTEEQAISVQGGSMSLSGGTFWADCVSGRSSIAYAVAIGSSATLQDTSKEARFYDFRGRTEVLQSATDALITLNLAEQSKIINFDVQDGNKGKFGAAFNANTNGKIILSTTATQIIGNISATRGGTIDLTHNGSTTTSLFWFADGTIANYGGGSINIKNINSTTNISGDSTYKYPAVVGSLQMTGQAIYANKGGSISLTDDVSSTTNITGGAIQSIGVSTQTSTTKSTVNLSLYKGVTATTYMLADQGSITINNKGGARTTAVSQYLLANTGGAIAITDDATSITNITGYLQSTGTSTDGTIRSLIDLTKRNGNITADYMLADGGNINIINDLAKDTTSVSQYIKATSGGSVTLTDSINGLTTINGYLQSTDSGSLVDLDLRRGTTSVSSMIADGGKIDLSNTQASATTVTSQITASGGGSVKVVDDATSTTKITGNITAYNTGSIVDLTNIKATLVAGNLNAYDSGSVKLTMVGNSTFTGLTSRDNFGAGSTGTTNLTLQDSSTWDISGDSSLTSLRTASGSALVFNGTNTKTSFTDITLNDASLDAGTTVTFLLSSRDGVTEGTEFKLINASNYSINSSTINFNLTKNLGTIWKEGKHYALEWDVTSFDQGILKVKAGKQIPEPTFMSLGMMGLATLLLRRRRA